MVAVKKIEPAGTIDLDTMKKVESPVPAGQPVQDWKSIKKDERLRVVLEGTVVAVQHIKNPKVGPSSFTVRTKGGLRTFFPDQEKIFIERI